jgi:ribosomal protein S3
VLASLQVGARGVDIEIAGRLGSILELPRAAPSRHLCF